MTNKNRITYAELFWLFMAGSLLGVIIEGVFCVFHYGHWETHTVAVWGPFCIIYGFGAVGLYIGAHHLRGKGLIAQFLVYALVCTVIEYLCGALLRYGLHMRAWDYTKSFLNFQGLICLNATLVWGAAGVIFSKWLAPPLRRLFMRMRGRVWRILCAGLSVFMAVNLLLTSACILRWADRHLGIKPADEAEQWLDEHYGNDVMQERFCEWRFED